MVIKSLTVALLFLGLFVASRQVEGKHWALLVAGSSGYENYRHQSDVCHAYHIVRNHGVPAEQVVLMLYDDVANSPSNPFPGNLINRPNGPNVYEGIVKDYTGNDVTPDVFLSVLSGDADGVENLTGKKGKVINSGPDDRIFVYFADHGAPGILGFPNEYLYANQISKTLKKMHSKNQYKEMVLYVEACESGSLFTKELLPDNMNIYATTAANGHESSYAWYFDKARKVYLGDQYSINWMEDSDKENLQSETLESQYEIVKQKTTKSHVCEWGDMTINKEPVGEFQGNTTSSLCYKPSAATHPDDGVKSEDVAMEIMKRTNNKEGLEKVVQRRDSTVKFFKELVTLVSNFDYETLRAMPVHINEFTCYKHSIDALKKECPGMDINHNDYAMRNFKVLAHLCEVNIGLNNIVRVISSLSTMSSLCVAN